MVDDSNDDGHPTDIQTKPADKILKNPAGYTILLFGIISGAFVIAAAVWGYFGEKVQSSVLEILDPSGRAALHQEAAIHQEVKTAKDRIAELKAELYRATARANQAEARLPKTAVPLEIVARVIAADDHKARVNLSILNISSSEIEFAFGPERPQLVVWGIGERDVYNSSSPGFCFDEDFCFNNTSLGKFFHRSLTLQAGARLATDLDFLISGWDHYDPSVLTMPKRASLSLPIRTADGMRTRMELPLVPN